MDNAFLVTSRLQLPQALRHRNAVQPNLESSARRLLDHDVLAGASCASCQTLGLVLCAISLRRSQRPRGCRGLARCARGVIDYYDVLGVSKNANEREIKSSFRKLARQYHPDINQEPGAQEKFQQIAKAYEVLSDSQKRQRYNQFGDGGLEGMSPGSDLSDVDLDDILGDVFSSFFGGRPSDPPRGAGVGSDFREGPRTTGRSSRTRASRARRTRAQKGSDLQCRVEIPFEVACFGGRHVVRINREELCETCNGQGTNAKGEKNQLCRRCGGAGVTVQFQQTPLGGMETPQACPKCKGSGIDPKATCQACSGKGTQSITREVAVNIPVGCNAGSRLRVRAEGDKGTRGGPPGDLYLTLKIGRSEEFVRDGADIYSEQVISVFDAMLGASVQISTVDGKAAVKAHCHPEIVALPLRCFRAQGFRSEVVQSTISEGYLPPHPQKKVPTFRTFKCMSSFNNDTTQ